MMWNMAETILGEVPGRTAALVWASFTQQSLGWTEKDSGGDPVGQLCAKGSDL